LNFRIFYTILCVFILTASNAQSKWDLKFTKLINEPDLNHIFSIEKINKGSLYLNKYGGYLTRVNEIKSSQISFQSDTLTLKWKIGKKLLSEGLKRNDELIFVLSKKNPSDRKLELKYKYQNNALANINNFNDLEKIIKDPDIIYVGKESFTAKTESRVIDMNLYSNNITLAQDKYPDLTGKGLIISVKENAYDFEDFDLVGRTLYTPYFSEIVDNHATEMATIIAGAGNSFITGRGVLTQSEITSENFENLFPNNDSVFQKLNILIQNHSYGTEIENFYGVLARSFDEQVFNNPDILHVFSAGNQGNEIAQDSKYSDTPGYATLTGNFKQSKNSIVVASVDTVGMPLDFISAGPAYDGRLKPELVAYSNVGSSNSAALVSGVCGMIIQKYQDVHDKNPNSSLIKSLLVSTSEDVFTPGPDFKTGYGNIDAYSAINVLYNNQYRENQISIGSTDTVSIHLDKTQKRLKIAISWLDPPSPLETQKALLNNLDMRINGPGNEIHYPWILDISPSSIRNPANKGIDKINNTELIEIENPQAGTYSIIIQYQNGVSENTTYSLSYHIEQKDTLYWEYPTSTNNFPYDGETDTYFQWKSGFSIDATGKLFVSYDLGSTWELISDNLLLSKEKLRWKPPILPSVAIAKIEFEDKLFLSDTFSISEPVRIIEGFDCTDSLMIKWKGETIYKNYDLFTLGNRYLEKIESATLPKIIFNPETLNSSTLKIIPKNQNNFSFIESPLYITNNLVPNCFLNSFLVETSSKENEISLMLNLSTSEFIDSVVFYKINGLEVNKIKSTVNTQKLDISCTDKKPSEGWNIYSASIFLSNNNSIDTEEREIFFVSRENIILFPNPVENSEELRIFSGITDGIYIQIFDSNGKLVYENENLTDREYISLYKLNPGMYYYRAQSSNKTQKGKLIVR